MLDILGIKKGNKMCEWGDTVKMEVTIPAHLSHSGREYRKVVDIDRCIAPLVKALNDGGITTVASCCGHGKVLGNIALADGRELFICPDYETARKIEWPQQKG
jgi:hypothetical protein